MGRAPFIFMTHRDISQSAFMGCSALSSALPQYSSMERAKICVCLCIKDQTKVGKLKATKANHIRKYEPTKAYKTRKQTNDSSPKCFLHVFWRVVSPPPPPLSQPTNCDTHPHILSSPHTPHYHDIHNNKYKVNFIIKS